jgi:hypothetical protein
MSQAEQNQQYFIKKVALLKTLADHPDAKIIEVAKNIGMSKTSAYHTLQEFSSPMPLHKMSQDFPQKFYRIITMSCREK